MKLPNYNPKSEIGENGITIVKRIVENEFHWIFRKNHQEHDFGIDAFIDVVLDKGQLTGKSIALQIKTGASYFEEKSSSGWIYRDSIEHLNYYLNHDIPVLILLVDEIEEKIYWNVCDATKTEKAGNNWKIVISFSQQLLKNSKEQIQQYISPVKDYASQLEHFWATNKMLMKLGRLVFNIDKEDIVSKNYQGLIEGLERLQVNPELIVALRGKVDIWIDGYDNDSRELYEIIEVKNWANDIFSTILGLAYFLVTDTGGQFLRLMQYIKSSYKIIEDNVDTGIGGMKRYVEIDLTTGVNFSNELFHDLNIFCEKHAISMDINKEITISLVEYLTGAKIPDNEKF